MPRYVIAFSSSTEGVIQKILETGSRESALRFFFENYVGEYSKNEEGFTYFREDFTDADSPLGSIIEV